MTKTAKVAKAPKVPAKSNAPKIVGEFTLDTALFSAALKHLSALAPKKASDPALECILIEAAGEDRVTLTAADSVAELTLTIGGKGTGAALFPVHAWKSATNGLNGPTTIQQTDKTVAAVFAGSLRTQRDMQSPATFPRLPAVDAQFAFTGTCDNIGWAIQECNTTTFKAGGRDYLAGIHFGYDKVRSWEGLRLVSTDGAALTRCQLPEVTPVGGKLTGALDLILPAATGEIAEKMLLGTEAETEVKVEIESGAMFRLSGPGWKLTSRAQAGTFPDHLRVIPDKSKMPHIAVFPAKELLAGCKVVAAGGGRDAYVTVEFGAAGVTLIRRGADADAMYDIPEAKVEGGEHRVSVALKQLFAAAHQAMGPDDDAEDQVLIRASTQPDEPVRFENPDNPDFLFITMPMKVAKQEPAPSADEPKKVEPKALPAPKAGKKPAPAKKPARKAA